MRDEPAPLSRRLTAEGLGTLILVATVVGSGIMAEQLAGGKSGNRAGWKHNSNQKILVVIITILGPASGAHFNPDVTLVLAARGEVPWSEVIPYIVISAWARSAVRCPRI